MSPATLLEVPSLETPSDAGILDQALVLPCGALLKNRIMKSAMAEGLAGIGQDPSPEHQTVYRRWSRGGAGLLVSGNIMLDREDRPSANVILDNETDAAAVAAWTAAGTAAGNHFWAQLNHEGRQAQGSAKPDGMTLSPSGVPFDPPANKLFPKSRAMEPQEIEKLVQAFGRAARIAMANGFTGVQIHAAHGYLVNQFLSPLTNVRTDAWGGSAERRMTFLREIYRAIRDSVGPEFPVSVKLNSADFQRGGFTEEESLGVIEWLTGAGIDLLEISGGTYEAAAMVGAPIAGTTAAREAYFLDFAEKVRNVSDTPLAVTGGFRTSAGMAAAVRSGAVDVVGLARALTIDPDAPRKILAGETFRSEVRPVKTGIGAIDRRGALETMYYGTQLKRIARGEDPRPDLSIWRVLPDIMWAMGPGARKGQRPGAGSDRGPVEPKRSPFWREPDTVIHTSIEIDAPLETVAAILTNFSSYKDWNPYVTNLDVPGGVVEPGTTVTFVVGGLHRYMKSTAEVLELAIEANRCALIWRSTMGNNTGTQFQIATATDDGRTRFEHTKAFQGPAAKWFPLGGWLRNHFEALNHALKRRAEEVAPRVVVQSGG